MWNRLWHSANAACLSSYEKYSYHGDMRKNQLSGGLVYSTEQGRMCPVCRASVAQCICKMQKSVPAGDGVVRVGRETKGRGGKGVTLVRGLALGDADLLVLAKQLKTQCGSGGTVKEGVIEIQGDHVEQVMASLQTRGHRVKRAGG